MTDERPELKVLLFTPDPAFGGGVYEFTNTLAARLGPQVQAEKFFIGRRPGRLGNLFRPIVPLVDAVRLLLLLIWRRHDIYHVNPSLNARSALRDGLFLLVLRCFPKRKVLVYFHGWDSEYFQRIARSTFLRRLFRAAYGRASLIMVLASEFKRNLEAIGFPAGAICTTTTMFDGELFNGIHRQRDDDDIWILSLGRLVEAKGIFLLLDAFKELSVRDSRLRLVIAGDGPDADRLRRDVSTYRLEDRVLLPGHVRDEQKAQLLADADMFVLPSSHGEGCPIALLEAMAAGLPVIVTPVGGVPDIVIQDKNGEVLNACNADTLASAIARFAADRSLRAGMGRENRSKAYSSYEADSVVGGLRKCYMDVLPGRKSYCGVV